MLPTIEKGAINVAFVRSSVCPCIMYIANNLRTQSLSMPEFGRKVSHLRCDSHASFKFKRSQVRVRAGWGHTVLAEPGDHTTCWILHPAFTYFHSLL